MVIYLRQRTRHNAERTNLMGVQSSGNRQEQLRARLQQLILMRETGPKRAAWHAARMRLIWRLHDEIKREEQLGPQDYREAEGAEPIEEGG